jgi:crotonobetainyl-CoA:carnitine CoA-transferase CaiB-like acyl-CoA transferase
MNIPADERPLAGITVVDLSQFLAGPLTSLRLADMGATVIKVERPGTGDLTRQLYLTDVDIGGTNTLFHAINRNKLGYRADLRNAGDLGKIRKLIAQADVVIQNFRPGVIEKYGLGYAGASAINERLVYASISGYGTTGEWVDLPGQDLLAQARTGLMWLSGDGAGAPVPMGISIGDQLAANHATQAILAGLVRRGTTGRGMLVETSLLEVLLDFQFELLTTHLNDPLQRLPQRSAVGNAHAYLAAPYGVYETADGYLAIAMTPIPQLAKVLGFTELEAETDNRRWFSHRDEIKARLAAFLKAETTAHWLSLLVPADIWASEVLDWKKLMATNAFKELDFVQTLKLPTGEEILTTRSPLRINGGRLRSDRPAPQIGEHNELIEQRYALAD